MGRSPSLWFVAMALNEFPRSADEKANTARLYE